MSEAPKNPAGEFVPVDRWDEAQRSALIADLEQSPAALSAAVAGLTDEQLDKRYRDWTIRQIVHHLGDSHLHSYIRFKWTLTEDHPTIKPYEEADWVALPDSRSGDIAPAVALFAALHGRWVPLLRSMTPDQFARTFHHPQTGETLSLDHILGYYAWHARHHTAQIVWLREQHGW